MALVLGKFVSIRGGLVTIDVLYDDETGKCHHFVANNNSSFPASISVRRGATTKNFFILPDTQDLTIVISPPDFLGDAAVNSGKWPWPFDLVDWAWPAGV